MGGYQFSRDNNQARSPIIMKALIYHGPQKKALEEVAKPQLQEATDAIIRILKTTLCGTDLHILKGDVPTVSDGRVLGHEGVGIIEQTGSGLTRFKPGDRVVISCITACGRCQNCRRGMCSHCEQGGWILGNTIDGTQAEFVRIPWADTSLHPMPLDADEEAMVMLSDILPTGYECGVLNGCVKPGDTVAIIGAGPIGLATLLTALFYAPADVIMIDRDEHRLNMAKKLGATMLINTTDGDAVTRVMSMTLNKGVDVAIEAVGLPETFDVCQRIVAAGGHIANVGVHGESVPLHLETLWSRNITITTRLVDAVTTPLLLKTVVSGRLRPQQLISHRFALADILEAYEVFSHASRERALKVILTSD
jgi:alcohol dehydrogenase